MKTIYSLLTLLFFFFQIHAQPPGWLWARGEGGGSEGEGRGLATDAAGNVVAAGVYYGTLTLGSITFPAAVNSNLFVVKYDASGNIQWAKSAQSSSSYANGVAMDSGGNVYVTGYFKGPTISFDAITITKPGTLSYIFIAKYDAAGSIQWVVSPDGNIGDHAMSIAVDGSGNSYITGSLTSDSLSFGNITLYNVNPGGPFYAGDFFIAKLNPAGGILWAKSVGDMDSEAGMSIAADASGAFVTGMMGNSTMQFGTTTLTGNVTNLQNIFIARFDSSGNAVWARGAGPGNPVGIAVDGSGNSYLTGNFEYDSVMFGAVHVMNPGSYNGFIAKYDAAGNALWGKAVVTNNLSAVFLRGIAALPSGKIFITGLWQGDSITFGSSLISSTHFGEVFAAQYDANGYALWAARGSGCCYTYQHSHSITTDASGNAFITGRYDSAWIAFGADTLPPSYFIAKLSFTTGVNEIHSAGNGISIFPNPFMSVIGLHFNEQTNLKATLIVLSVQGEILLENEIRVHDRFLDLSALPPGIYFVEVKSEADIFVQKVVK
jgi:hypothetical protein